jgi:hypothetical protein
MSQVAMREQNQVDRGRNSTTRIKSAFKMNPVVFCRSLSESLAICFPMIYRFLIAFDFHLMCRFWDPIRRTTVQENANIIDLKKIRQWGCVGRPRSSRQRCECDHCTKLSTGRDRTNLGCLTRALEVNTGILCPFPRDATMLLY